MATQPQFDTPQLRGIAQLMSSFADMDAQDRQDERDLMALFDPREQAKREMEGALARAEIAESQGKLDLGQKELDALTAFREGQLALEGRLGDMNSLLTALDLEGKQNIAGLNFITSDTLPALLAAKDEGGKPTGLALLTESILQRIASTPGFSSQRLMPTPGVQVGMFPLGRFQNLIKAQEGLTNTGDVENLIQQVIQRRPRYNPKVMLGEDPTQ